MSKQPPITHKYVPPRNLQEAAARQAFHEMFKHIKEPHCIICGETETEAKKYNGTILVIQTNVCQQTFCKFCYDCQQRMK